mmetsp:Transcript_74092/g.165774  ORF Transcript_74092/g.165774 Transcript_74092/m.165774 type:complete len:516 (-) Transcript_74092:105-1652(-)
MSSVSITGMFKAAASRLDLCGGRDMRNSGLLVAAFACAVLPLDISHLISALIGMVAYLSLQALQPTAPHSATGSKREKVATTCRPSRSPPASQSQGASRRTPSGTLRSPSATPCSTTAQSAEIRRPSVMPVSAPTFKAVGLDAEANELLKQISPSAEGEATVTNIARTVKRLISPILPEAEVDGFACGSILGGTAFGVAVPEVDIVITVSPDVLLGRLQGRWGDARSASWRIDAWKLQKSAIRACTDRLVGNGSFKFRRSAFREQEPKVTIIAPAGLRAAGQGVPVNLSVNAVTPLYSWALLTECGRIERRAKELALFVKRWAKDRGLCHAAKGHLSPYSWTLLSMFFMQVADPEHPYIPAMEGFVTSPQITEKKKALPAPPSPPSTQTSACKQSLGSLFQSLVSFYHREFDWQKEAVSVRLGRRGPPMASLPLHIILHSDGQTSEVGPSIEDPFRRTNNLGNCMTASSFARLREEFARAEKLCASQASLTQLLEPWAPPECGAGEKENEEEDAA